MEYKIYFENYGEVKFYDFTNENKSLDPRLIEEATLLAHQELLMGVTIH